MPRRDSPGSGTRRRASERPVEDGRDLETGGIDGEARADGLDQGLLHRPQAVEQVDLPLRVRRFERGPFVRREQQADVGVQIAAARALLQIHADAAGRSHGDQPVLAAVADIEGGGCRTAADEGERLAAP